MNPLENDSDDGDGPRINGKVAFYRDKDDREIPIRIVKLPAGVTLSAEREGPCPDAYQRETCYGGKLTFSVKILLVSQIIVCSIKFLMQRN